MNSLIEKGIIEEAARGANFSYILNDNGDFLLTEYKVLQSQIDECFVKCMKVLYNGKIELYYLVEKYKSLESILPTLTNDNFLIVISNLFSNILDAKTNGFFKCQNIEISFSKIFVDTTTLKVSLIYLPTASRSFEDVMIFENKLRTSLIKSISKTPQYSSAKVIQLLDDLSNGQLSIRDLYNKINVKGNFVTTTAKADVKAKKLRLISMNTAQMVKIDVIKDDFILGKSTKVDGILSFNKAISKRHCKISKVDNEFVIVDLNSTNGTYLNKVKLVGNLPKALKNGDVVRLANSDFQIMIN